METYEILLKYTVHPFDELSKSVTGGKLGRRLVQTLFYFSFVCERSTGSKRNPPSHGLIQRIQQARTP